MKNKKSTLVSLFLILFVQPEAFSFNEKALIQAFADEEENGILDPTENIDQEQEEVLLQEQGNDGEENNDSEWEKNQNFDFDRSQSQKTSSKILNRKVVFALIAAAGLWSYYNFATPEQKAQIYDWARRMVNQLWRLGFNPDQAPNQARIDALRNLGAHFLGKSANKIKNLANHVKDNSKNFYKRLFGQQDEQ